MLVHDLTSLCVTQILLSICLAFGRNPEQDKWVQGADGR